MRILTALPQDDLNDVPAAARAAEAAGAVAPSGGYGMRQEISRDLIQDIRRIPSAFAGYRTGW